MINPLGSIEKAPVLPVGPEMVLCACVFAFEMFFELNDDHEKHRSRFSWLSFLDASHEEKEPPNKW